MAQRALIVHLLLMVTVIPRAIGDDGPGDSLATWQDAARKQDLTEAEIALLEKSDILLTNKEYRQIYSAYAPQSGISVFITSDSLLNAYHVLLEESFVQREANHASRLSETLRMILKDMEVLRFSIKDQPDLNAAAQRRARLVIGIAVRLLDKTFRLGDAELDEILAVEASRIEAAEAELLPEWLGVPGPSLLAIHYSRFRPRSFYTRNVQLERYFRAVSWLQAIPFRIERDEELLAILMLGHAVREQPPDPEEEMDDFARFEAYHRAKNAFRYYYEFVGDPDLPDILAAADQAYLLTPSDPEMLEEEMLEEETLDPQDSDKETPEAESEEPEDGKTPSSGSFGSGSFGGGSFGGGSFGEAPQEKILLLRDLHECRESLQIQNSETKPQINDQDREPPDDPQQVDDLQFRIISASRTPDAVLFQRTTDPWRFGHRAFPSGIEVAVALGSAPARTFLNDPEKERLLQEIDSSKDLFRQKNLYGTWLNTLMALFDEPEHDAPDFMRSDAWQRKSCNTVLASWTQLRHTVALHAKVNGGGGGGSIPPPGFVEPDPEFFSRMANLAENTKSTLYPDGDLQPILPDYRPLLPVLESLRGLANGVDDAATMDWKREQLSHIEGTVSNLANDIAELVVQQSDSGVAYRAHWNQTIDQELSPAKIESLQKMADGVSDSVAMYEKLHELSISSSSISGVLFYDLANLTDKHPQAELPWNDRWNQLCDQYLPKVLKSLRHLADGISDAKEMDALIEHRSDYKRNSLQHSITYLVHKLTVPPVDSQISYSDFWDCVIDQLIYEIKNDSSEKRPALTAIVDTGVSDLGEVWDELIRTSRRLEVIAHKQLRGADLNESETWFVLGYGETLAQLMLRHKFSSEDDAPWAIGVYTNHLLRQTLHAATSRPRALYVLYPWRGTKVLSRGAIVPYREVIVSSPLTDEEWRQQLDSGTAPPLPDWLQPILSPAP